MIITRTRKESMGHNPVTHALCNNQYAFQKQCSLEKAALRVLFYEVEIIALRPTGLISAHTEERKRNGKGSFFFHPLIKGDFLHLKQNTGVIKPYIPVCTKD